MAEDLIKAGRDAGKKERYDVLLPQIRSLVEGEDDLIANLANLMAALKESMNFLWVGVYFVKENELVLGPFQGPIACSRIAFGKGVCGTAWQREEIIIVDNVDEFPGHIACSSSSRSEIVLPIYKNGKVQMVLDVDSESLANFDETDIYALKQVTHLIEKML